MGADNPSEHPTKRGLKRLTAHEREVLKERFGIEASADATLAEVREVLKQRFGIETSADATLAEVAKQFDLVQAKIRKLERLARKKSGSDRDPDDSA